MKIVWTDFATRNLKDIFEYYSTKVNKETNSLNKYLRYKLNYVQIL
ncbi:plasmid stabilization system protein ParE [Pedobacter sp. UYP30]